LRILVVEDQIRLAANLKKGLETVPSYVVDMAHNGVDGEHLAMTEAYDVIVLDLMLPGRDGLAVLQNIRAAGRTAPVLILTAKNTPEDIVRGLDYGSDDYLAKPFDFGELLARIKALIRRSHGKPAQILRVGQLAIDTRTHTVDWLDTRITMRPIEYRLLEYLAYHAEVYISKTQLLEHLYDYNWDKFSNVIEVHVSALRRRLESNGAPRIIHTARGQGYCLTASEPGADGSCE
jgi:DNA-binding response OmpR family regulator